MPVSSRLGGFMFKQWKERYIVLTADGNLLVCRDVDSPPDQVVSLHGGCEAIVKGGEILDLPRLPNTGRRDCSFALILPQKKFLLLLAENPSDCRCVARGASLQGGWGKCISKVLNKTKLVRQYPALTLIISNQTT
uniref:PH domain-containing protein n=1 Tax=Paramormyrops kingsleyae TaxID=1676925 RepID=A0A3B3TF90_9TELE